MRLVNSFFCLLLFSTLSVAQTPETTFEDFIREHRGLADQPGELVPIDIEQIDRKVRFFIEEKYPKIVEKIENILWDAYATFSSNANRSHNHRFIVQVVVRGDMENKFIEVNYDPLSKQVSNQVFWSNEDQEFIFEADFLARENTKSDLIALSISNLQPSPDIEKFVATHQGFIDLALEKNRGQNYFVPLDMKALNPLVSQFVASNYPEVEYTRNVTWNTYSTYISPYSSHHYHTFLAHVKVKGIRQTQYLEVFYNPMTNQINSDRKWIAEVEKFIKTPQKN